MISPPKSVLLVVECLCCLLKVELKPLDNIWDISKKMLGDSRFVQSIASFDKESLNATIMNRIEKLVNVPEFGIKDLYNTSQAVGSLGNWILAIEKYWQSVVITDSKKKLIGELNIKIDQIKQNLERKQSKKEEGDILLNKIKSNFDSLIKNKDSISKSYKDAQNRLSGSKEISKYLVATRERVVEQLNAAESKKHLVFGSVALGSSLSAFFLEFSQSVRESARLELEKWLDLNKILHEKGQSISSLLLVSIDDYNFHNLTQDDYNVDNIISTLFINNCILICDPYKQVYQRIAALERGKSFISLSSKDARFHDLMFQAVQQNSSIVLSVYENEPDSFMKSLLKGRFWSKSNMTPFKLHYNGQTIVTKFSKLYLVLECPYSLVSKSWLKYTIAIKGTLEIEALSAILVDISLPNDIKGFYLINQRTKEIF